MALSELRIGMIPAAEAAAQLHMSRNWVSRLCAEGRLPATRIAGRWFVDRAAVVAFRRRPRGRPRRTA